MTEFKSMYQIETRELGLREWKTFYIFYEDPNEACDMQDSLEGDDHPQIVETRITKRRLKAMATEKGE